MNYMKGRPLLGALGVYLLLFKYNMGRLIPQVAFVTNWGINQQMEDDSLTILLFKHDMGKLIFLHPSTTQTLCHTLSVHSI